MTRTLTTAALLAWCSALFLVGCQSPVLPNPQKADQVGQLDAKYILSAYNNHRQNLLPRKLRGEITEEQMEQMLRDYIMDKAAQVDLDSIPEDQALDYGHLMRLGGEWELAETLYRDAAVVGKVNNDWDLQVNALLKEAWAAAELKKPEEAIKLARESFDVPPEGKAPILFAVLYEIAPALEGQGHEEELAQLLLESIEQHSLTVVDPSTEAGQAFFAGRTHHVSTASGLIYRLLRDAGKDEDADKAQQKVREYMRREGIL